MRTVLITGANGFLGSHLYKEFQARGWHVIPWTRTECDFLNSQSITEAIRTLAVPEAIVHTAWPKLTRTKLIDTPQAESHKHYAAAEGSALFLSAVGQHMQARGNGTIIGITTKGLDSKDPNVMGAYLPAKAALRETLRLLSRELSPVLVHEVAPGFMGGGLNDDLPPRLFEMMEEKGTLTSPLEVAKQVADLIETSSTESEL